LAPNYNSQYSEFAPNAFAQNIAQPFLNQGRKLGNTGDSFNIASLIGTQDPGMSLMLNTIMQPLLTSFIGNKYMPAQFSAGGNLYSQMRMGDALRGQSMAMGSASQVDKGAIFKMLQGTAALTGQRFGARERESANQMAETISGFMPMAAQFAPDFVDSLNGTRGSATVMAQNMFKGARYATDPVTGRRGMSANSVGELSKNVYERLYGDRAEVSQMNGLTAGKAGALYDELQRRGTMPNSGGRGEGIRKIAEQMEKTVGEVSNMPDLDSKLRQFDADKIAGRLKGMSKAVAAMQEVFGEMGESNAPMSQLVGAIETLTQANMQGMEPHKLEKMVRDTSNTAKAAGIEMPEMFRLMGASAGMADRMGVNRAFVPGTTNQAVLENDAAKRIYGGAKGFGLSSSDKLMDIQQQLNTQALKDPRVNQIANIARAVDRYKFKPTEGSELESVYKAITNPSSGGVYETTDANGNKIKKNVSELSNRPGGVSAFLLSSGMPVSLVQDLQATQEANEEYMFKYNMGTNVGRPTQNKLFTDELTKRNTMNFARYSKDDKVMDGVNQDLKSAFSDPAIAEAINKEASDALINAPEDEIGKPEITIRKSLEKSLKKRNIKFDSPSDTKLIDLAAGGTADSSLQAAKASGFPSIGDFQKTLSNRVLEEARISNAEVQQQSGFESMLADVGKTDLTQRLTDFVRNANSKTSASDAAAAVLNFVPKDKVQERFAPLFEQIKEASTAYNDYDAEKVKHDYLNNAIAINEAELSNQDTSEEKRKTLEIEKNQLKDQLITSGLASTDGVDSTYDSIVAEAKRNSQDYEATARSNISSFKERHGVTADEAKINSARGLAVIGRGAKQAELKAILEKAGIEFTAAGFMSNATGGLKEVNDINKQINDADPGEAAYGLDMARNFLDKYTTNEGGLLEKGGKKGLEIRDKAAIALNRIVNSSDELGITKEDYMNKDLSKVNFNFKDLQAENKEDIDVLTQLSSTAPGIAVASRTRVAEKVKTLSESKDPKDLRKAERLQGLLDIKKDNLGAAKDKAIKLSQNLTEGSETAIKAAYESFTKAEAAKKSNDTAVDAYIKETKLGYLGITKDTLAKAVEPTDEARNQVLKLREDLAKETSTEGKNKIKEDIAKVIKDSGAQESKFNTLTGSDRDEALRLVARTTALTPAERKKKEGYELVNGIKAANSKFNETDKAELAKLDDKKREAVSDKTVELTKEFGREFDGENKNAVSQLLNKYGSVKELQRFSVDDPQKSEDIKNILELSGYTSKNKVEQAANLAQLYNVNKAEQAGIKYGQSFVIKDGKAVVATDEEVASGNFINLKQYEKDGSKYRKYVDSSKFGYRKDEARNKVADLEKELSKATTDEQKSKIKEEIAKVKKEDEIKVKQFEEFKNIEYTNEDKGRHNELVARKEARAGLLKKHFKTEAELADFEAITAKSEGGAGLTEEETKRYKALQLKSGLNEDQFKSLPSVLRSEEERRKQLNDPKVQAKIKEYIAKGDIADKDKDAALEKMAGFNAQAKAAALGKDNYGKLSTAETDHLTSLLTDLSVQSFSGEGPKLSDKQKANINKARAIMVNDPKEAKSPMDFFKEEFGQDKGTFSAKFGDAESVKNKREALNKVSSSLSYAAREAFDLSENKNKQGATPQDRLKELRTLLATPNEKLNKKQLALKEGVIAQGYVEEGMIDEKGDLVASKVNAKVRATDAKIKKENMLQGKEGDPSFQSGKVVAVIDSKQPLAFSGKLDIFKGMITGFLNSTKTVT
jgi:hypothetical protein